MQKEINFMLKSFLGANRATKIGLQVFADSLIFCICFILSMIIRLESIGFVNNVKVWIAIIFSIIGALVAFWVSDFYKEQIRSLTGKIVGTIARGAFIFALLLLALTAIIGANIPRSVPIMAAALSLLTIGGLRFFVRDLFRGLFQPTKRPVAIYGASDAGRELLNSLLNSREYDPVVFIDDDLDLQGLMIGGRLVHPPSSIPELKKKLFLEEVLLALPYITAARRREIVSELQLHDIEFKTIPAMNDIISGKTKVSQIRNVTPEELLGRDPVPPDENLLRRSVSGKAVMVTGAGGSIGSELCRQILNQNPTILVLYEISELALYSIEAELNESGLRQSAKVKIVPILGSVRDEIRLDAVMKAFKVQTVYHAAAYKHVPIVEENVVEGIQNNVFGTLAAARCSSANGVERFILVSTDKAVRPTNVMGATKRISELICQGLAQENSKTVFAMVRFGNVLGSSGSVIPRFTAQIQAGGPITVTHPEITRYFMTIPEASQLVIQAGAMARGGEVFVLDMGTPIKIVDLAVTMVKLHGLKPRLCDGSTEADLNGDRNSDIFIRFTGLRKGEKLFEELLIGNDPKPTLHPRVMSASEECVDLEKLIEVLDRLRQACALYNLAEIMSILKSLPLSYTPTGDEVFDLTWIASRDECVVYE